MPDYTCAECSGFVGASIPDSLGAHTRVQLECLSCMKKKFVMINPINTPLPESGVVVFDN